MKNILLFEPDKETEELFNGWLRDVGYAVSLTDNLEEIPHLSTEKKFDILMVDIDSPGTADSLLEQCATLIRDPRLSNLPVAVLTYKKDMSKIARSIESGIETFILKPFDVEALLMRLDTIFDEQELKLKGRKILDLNYVDYLLELANQSNHKDFFTLSPLIFNVLIMDKVKTTLGEPVINVMAKRLDELIGSDYEFIKHVRFSDSHINMEEVELVSSEVPVEKLVIAFRDYIYAFLHLTRALTSDILVERKANL